MEKFPCPVWKDPLGKVLQRAAWRTPRSASPPRAGSVRPDDLGAKRSAELGRRDDWPIVGQQTLPPLLHRPRSLPAIGREFHGCCPGRKLAQSNRRRVVPKVIERQARAEVSRAARPVRKATPRSIRCASRRGRVLDVSAEMLLPPSSVTGWQGDPPCTLAESAPPRARPVPTRAAQS